MAEDYQLLMDIARNSGRDSYITDERFDVLWSNGAESLTSVLLGLKKPLHEKVIRRETALACKGGRALKITPVITDGKVRYFFFELYGSNDLLNVLGATGAFDKFTKAADRVRGSMLDYAQELAFTANTVNRSGFGRLCASSVNFMAILRILGGSGFEGTEEVSERLRMIGSWFSALSARSGDFVFETDIDEKLYAVTEKTAFECAVVNLLMNAYLHSVPPEGKKPLLKLSAFADAGKVVILVEDNGCKADPEYVAGFREVFLQPAGDGGEGLGVSLAEVFCRRFGGELRFSASPVGGLRAEIRLPFSDPRTGLNIFASSDAGRGISEVRDILRKGFKDEDIEDLVAW